MSSKRRGLGRGLDALIKEMPKEQGGVAKSNAEQQPQSGGQVEVAVNKIKRNPFQPRREFSEESLSELVNSIRVSGVLQPLLVREKDDGFELIAGERRLRASLEVGLKQVPVRVMSITDEQALEIALVENLQREDLNPVDEAKGYRTLMDRFDLKQEDVAQRVGKARATVANSLRLLHLEERVQDLISSGAITSGHAKVLAGFEIGEEQVVLAEMTAKQGFSVRQLEKEAAKRKRPPRKPRAFKPDISATQLKDLEDQLQKQLGTAVNIDTSRTLSNGKRVQGKITIDYYDSDELDRLLVMLGVQDII